jgi:DNA (cytosine-5)-methyltransferase 1
LKEDGINACNDWIKSFYRHLTGGMDLAFEAAGGRVAAMCEKDEFCRKILRKHWPTVPVFEDIYDLTGNKVKEVVGHGRTIDIIFGGFPCQ